MTGALIVLLLVAAERLAELFISERNIKRLKAEGAEEHGAGHYPFIVAVHTLWMAALFGWAVAFPAPLNMFWLIIYAVLQVLRVWVMVTLGRYWTTRIITVPHAPLIKRGPYKFVRHPNYTVVVLEIIVLPLMIGAWPLAVVFSIFNAAALWVRIRAENKVLAARA